MSTDFHPDLRTIASVLPRAPFSRKTLPFVRAVTRLMALRTPKEAEVRTLPGGTGVRVHRPTAYRHDGAAMLWIHGGGYVIGSAAQDDGTCRRFAHRLGIPVVAVDYRLAPRHPYPAALEDCYDALTWMSRLPGVDSERVVIGGASAGGGLAAALAFLARDRAGVQPLLQLLVYPMVDDRPSTRSPEIEGSYRMWNVESNALSWELYLRGNDPLDAVPARRNDVAGVAAAWVGVGTLDPLYDEGVEYARKLVGAGVDCEIDIVTGAFHGFDAIAPKAGVSRDFFDRQCQVIEAALAP